MEYFSRGDKPVYHGDDPRDNFAVNGHCVDRKCKAIFYGYNGKARWFPFKEWDELMNDPTDKLWQEMVAQYLT
jgi:hypothetical protein